MIKLREIGMDSSFPRPHCKRRTKNIRDMLEKAPLLESPLNCGSSYLALNYENSA